MTECAYARPPRAHFHPATMANAAASPANIAEAAAARRAMDAALNLVSREFSLPISELRARSRRRAPVAFGRQVAAYLAHVGCGFTLTALGAALGRDRTTLGHAARRIEDARDDAALDERLDRLEAALTAELRGDPSHPLYPQDAAAQLGHRPPTTATA